MNRYVFYAMFIFSYTVYTVFFFKKSLISALKLNTQNIHPIEKLYDMFHISFAINKELLSEFR